MAAGVATRMYGPLDWNGGETSELIQHWPNRPREYGQPLEKERYSTNAGYGRLVHCNAGDSYDPPGHPAGQSKRITAFYSKTGVLEHRTEPQFRDYKGGSGLTEVHAEPLYTRPTFQSTAPLILTRTAKQRSGILGNSQSAPNLHPPGTGASQKGRYIDTTLRPSELGYLQREVHDMGTHQGQPGYMPQASARSRSSGASRHSAARSVASGRSRQSHQSLGAASGRSRQSLGGASGRSGGSATPSWYGGPYPAPGYDFDPLPMYSTSAKTIGQPAQQVSANMAPDHPTAGLTRSGFKTPRTLMKNFTEPYAN